MSSMLFAQHPPQTYVPETDPLVLEKIKEWQDLKFGLLMHWGPYSQWGIVESWSICPEDEGWCRRKSDDYYEYIKEYENLKTTFNPVYFNPEKWAKAAKNAGMRYVVFTTKHHDGFCMFDSKYTDYKITDQNCPFHTAANSNIAKEIFDAFREEGLWTGAYFSKPDWHCEDYWWPNFPPKDRNVNYDPLVYPEKWENYVQFTQNQILELMTDYGKMDILWLDGGWVANYSDEEINDFYSKKINSMNSGFLKGTIVRQDIRMDEIVERARKKQEGLIVVDRAVAGKNQNYLTPENRVPPNMLPYPWESCIIAGGSWSWVPNAKYKSPRETIHLLCDIVCKGGNLLLNIAPGPNGKWDKQAYDLLDEVGKWMDVNGEAIYNTTTHFPYKNGNICLTKNDFGNIFAIYLLLDENDILPEKVFLSNYCPLKGSKIEIIGRKGNLKWKKSGKGFEVEIPEKYRINPPCQYAFVLKITEHK